MLRLMFSALFVLLTVGQAASASLPTFDTNNYCKKAGLIGRPDQAVEMVSVCTEQEYEAKINVNAALNHVTSDMMETCKIEGASVGGSYTVLHMCLDFAFLERKMVPPQAFRGTVHKIKNLR